MAASRTGLWLIVGGTCLCLFTCACGAVIVSELKQLALLAGPVTVGVAKALGTHFEATAKGFAFLNWLISALLGWLQKSIVPFL